MYMLCAFVVCSLVPTIVCVCVCVGVCVYVKGSGRKACSVPHSNGLQGKLPNDMCTCVGGC